MQPFEAESLDASCEPFASDDPTADRMVQGELFLGLQLTYGEGSSDCAGSAVLEGLDAATIEGSREAALLELSVQKAVGLKAMDLGGVSDPYVIIKVGSQAAQRTTVKQKTVNPTWDETFSFRIESMDDDVVLDVWDQDQLADDYMGQVQLGTIGQLLSIHTQMAGRGGVNLQQRLQPKNNRMVFF